MKTASGSYKTMLSTSLVTSLLAPSAFAADPQSAPSPGSSTPAPQVQEAIVVTGSRIAKRDFESSSPIVTVDKSVIAAAGQPTLDKAIGEMPQFSAAQGMSEVGDVQGRTGFAGGQAYGDLRGLGPNRALFLMDGRRLMQSNPNGSIDLNTIPMVMIENVEIISGGASATYGSDAIAGVMNFKLRQRFSGAEFSANHGGTTQGDGKTNQFSALFGGNFDNERGNAVFAFEYSDRAKVSGSTRPFFRDIRQLARPPEGIIGAGNFGSAPTIAAVNSVLAGYPGTTPITGSGAYNGAIGVNTDGTIFTDLAGTNCVQNYRGLNSGLLGLNLSSNCRQIQIALGNYFSVQVPLTKYNVFARSTYNFSDALSAYGQFNFMESSARDETAAGSTGPAKYLSIPVNSPFVTSNPALMTILASRPAVAGNPTALTQPLSYTKLLTASGPRVQSFRYNVYQAVGGVKGDIPRTPLTFDLYSSIGRTTFTNVQQNDTSKAAIAAILNGTANYSGSAGNCIGYAWNPFGDNPLSPGCREFATRENHNFYSITQKIVEGTVQGPIYALPAGDLGIALGADFRSSQFEYQPDHSLATADSPSYDTSTPTGGKQNVRELFAEVDIPLLKDLPFVKSLSTDLGYRRSRYDGFGAVSAYKADVSWKPVEELLVRGGYQRAIRAPSLGELFAPTITGTLNIGSPPNAGDPCDVRSVFRTGASAAQVAALCQAQGVPAALFPTYTYVNDSVFGTQGGNTKLTPETADTKTIGAVWSPRFQSALFRNFHVSLDYYNIKLKDAIGSVALTTILPRCFNSDGSSNPGYSPSNIFCSQITRDRNTGNIVLGQESLLNLATYKTDGIDLQIDWGFKLEALGLPASAGNFRLTPVVSYTHSFKVSSLPGSPVLDYAGSIGSSAVSAEIAHPHYKANTAFVYSVGPLTTGLHWRYIDKMKDQSLVADPTSTAPGVPSYSYFDIDARVKLREGIELSAGVTNVADKAPPFVTGQPLTTDSATYDIIGRRYFVAAKFKF